MHPKRRHRVLTWSDATTTARARGMAQARAAARGLLVARPGKSGCASTPPPGRYPHAHCRPAAPRNGALGRCPRQLRTRLRLKLPPAMDARRNSAYVIAFDEHRGKHGRRANCLRHRWHGWHRHGNLPAAGQGRPYGHRRVRTRLAAQGPLARRDARRGDQPSSPRRATCPTGSPPSAPSTRHVPRSGRSTSW